MLSQSDEYRSTETSSTHFDAIVPDFDAAIECARERFSLLPAYLTYHSFDHTFHEVMPAALRLARVYGINERQTGLLAVAVAYHDIGWTIQNHNHERAGIAIARLVLPGFGFDREDIGLITGMILTTRLPQSPTSLLEEIIADADLDCLGCPVFWERSQALRSEQEHFGQVWSDSEWWQIQIKFLEGHSYFTEETRGLREENKQMYIRVMREMIDPGHIIDA